MKMLISLFSLLFAVQALANAETLIATGTVFDKDKKEKVFTYERYQDQKGDLTFDRALYKTMDGEIATEEKMERRNGKIVRYDIDQKQLKQKGWIVVEGQKVTFNLKKFKKRNYPQTEDLKDNFIMGLQIVDHVKKNWDELSSGKKKEISLGVWHRQEMITFDLDKDDRSTNKELVIKMNPSSMFIRALVDPIYFHFDRTTKELSSYVGRVTPKMKRGRSYYDYDGYVTYQMVKAGAAPKAAMKKATQKK
jgi:hypothetical protein